MSKIFNCFVRSLPLTFFFVLSGYLISHVILNNPQLLDFILFIIGAIPIVIFLPSVFSQSRSGAIHTPKVIFRKVETLVKRERKEIESNFPALSYVFAGALTWLFSWIIY